MRFHPDDTSARALQWLHGTAFAVAAVVAVVLLIQGDGGWVFAFLSLWAVLFALQWWTNRSVARSDLVVLPQAIQREGPRGWTAAPGDLVGAGLDGRDLVLTPDPDKFDARLRNAATFTRWFGPGRGRTGVVVIRLRADDVPEVAAAIAPVQRAIDAASGPGGYDFPSDV